MCDVFQRYEKIVRGVLLPRRGASLLLLHNDPGPMLKVSVLAGVSRTLRGVVTTPWSFPLAIA
ncbi:7009_t:CDS:2 [Funneliformis mosseae]|uniref:7009_t:CDS:1 n=1 Tax=Funneliformis mosseae TaxID=27381 RepID=A0A9N9HHH6_FUNMO|nr:7009_t:CDS:2 [Funneliformis mosseae]